MRRGVQVLLCIMEGTLPELRLASRGSGELILRRRGPLWHCSTVKVVTQKVLSGVVCAVLLWGGTLRASAGSSPRAPTAAAANAGSAAALVALERMEQQARRGQWEEVLQSLWALEAEIASKAPLLVVDHQVLSAPPRDFGMYVPLVGEVRGSEVILYAQVRNHGLRTVHGHHELHLVTDLVFLDEQGRELRRFNSYGESRYSTRFPHRDTMVVVALNARGLGSGTFRVRLVIHDRIAKKEASVDFAFAVP